MNDNENDIIYDDDDAVESNGSPEAQVTSGTTPQSAGRVGIEVFSWFDTLIHALIAVVVIFTFFTRMTTVDGTSMLPNLEDQQRLMATDLFYEPAYNDIVVVWADNLPNDEGGYGKAIVKRVVGLSGDSIRIDYKQGYVYRNGEQLPVEVKDGFLYEDGHIINTYTNEEEGRGAEFTVPEGHIFVMGDNRNGSTDSRSYMVGDIDKRCIIGIAYVRVFPFDKLGGIY